MSKIRGRLSIMWLGVAVVPVMAAVMSPVASAQMRLDLEMHWDPGAEDCDAAAQKIQAHAINEDTIAIRQNPCVDFEAPLMYLLIGEERALLIDSGATNDPRLTDELTALVSSYLQFEDGSRLPLFVAHTHPHQDHRAGDAAFAALPETTVVPYDGKLMREFFGFDEWPQQTRNFQLGGREIVVIPTPGHHEDHVAFLDSATSLLFTGDFYLPGRLLVDDLKAYEYSALIITEVALSYGVTHALGGHVEMREDGELYSHGSTHHPDERQVAMRFDASNSVRLRQDLQGFNGFRYRHADYVILNPTRILMAIAFGALVALALLIWVIRQVRRAKRERRAAEAAA